MDFRVSTHSSALLSRARSPRVRDVQRQSDFQRPPRDSKALGEDFDAHFGTYTGINGKFVLDGKRVRLAPERG